MVKKVGRVAVVLMLILGGLTGLFAITPPTVKGYTPHDPIFIDGDDDFAMQAANESWPGDGSVGNPYIIEGYEINGFSTEGIDISSTRSHFIIRYMYLWDLYTGIDLWNVTNGTIDNCIIRNNSGGIRLFATNGIQITDNSISDSPLSCILWWNSKGNTFNNNTMIGGGIDIGSDWSTQNIDDSNTVNGKPLYFLKDQTGGTIPPDAGQIILVNCTNIIVENQNISNVSNGIQLVSSSNITLRNNILSSNREQDDFYYFLHGISLESSSENTITNNTLSNYVIAISLDWDSHRNNIKNNNLSYNRYGIEIDSDWNNVTDNNASNNDYGIRLWGSMNKIANNTLYFNSEDGIYLRSSKGNNITNNTMTDNGIHISGHELKYYNSHHIDISNTINDKPIYYLKNLTGGKVPSDAGQVILANCSNVVVENLTLENTSIGILIAYSSNNNITKNVCKNKLYGIYLDNSWENNITHNDASSNGKNGIHIENSYGGGYSFGNNISSNIVHNNTYSGIYLEFSNNDFIFNNTVSNNEYGIYLEVTDGNIIKDNFANENNEHGIYIYHSDYNNISSNDANLNGKSGMCLEDSYNNDIIDNNAFYNSENGIDIIEGSGNVLVGNNASGNSDCGFQLFLTEINEIVSNKAWHNGEHGFCFRYSDFNVMLDNNASSNNEHGIFLHFSDNINILNNHVNSNLQGGIYLNTSSENDITDNSISENEYGIYSYYLGRDDINNNDIFDNEYGIYLRHSALNNIIQNSISDNTVGIFIQNSSNNIIHHNNIINNTDQYEETGGTNTWHDDDDQGNYWSDYEGKDKNGDGTGDTKIPHQGVDSHPLTEPNTVEEEEPFPIDSWTLGVLAVAIVVLVIIIGIIRKIKKLSKMPPEEYLKENGEEQEQVPEQPPPPPEPEDKKPE